MTLKKTLAEMEQACPNSEAQKRLTSLFDEDSFVELDKFTTSKSSVAIGYGTIDSETVYAFSQDSSVKSGAINIDASNKLNKIYGLAVKNGAPIIGIYDSNGGDINEGTALIAAYNKILTAQSALSGVVPQIAVVLGPCAGVTAITACMSDILIMTETSELFVTAPSIAKDSKFVGAGTALNAAKSGVAAIVEKDAASAIATAKKIVTLLPHNNLSMAQSSYSEENAKEITKEINGIDLVTAIADKSSVCELYKQFGGNAVTAIAGLKWQTVGFVCAGINGSKLTNEDSSKIARFVSMCDSFSIPVITIIDTQGFEPSAAAELSGSIRDTAKLAQTYSTATTPKIGMITGKAYGGAFATLASNDFTISYPDAEISALSPMAAAVFLHADKIKKNEELTTIAEQYAANEASPLKATEAGIVDVIIEPQDARATIISAIDMLSDKRVIAPSRKHVNFIF